MLNSSNFIDTTSFQASMVLLTW